MIWKIGAYVMLPLLCVWHFWIGLQGYGVVLVCVTVLAWVLDWKRGER